MGVIPGRAGSTPIYWNMLTAAPDVVGQGTWFNFVSGAYLFGSGFTSSAGADGDNFTMNFRCPAGTYTLHVSGDKNTANGVLDIYVDDVEKGSFDHWAAVGDFDNVDEVTGIVLTEGLHTLKFQVDGKHGSSTGYAMEIEGIYLQRTA